MAKEGETLLYRPALLGQAKVHFAQAAKGVDVWEEATLLIDAEDVGEDAWQSGEVQSESPEFDDGPVAVAQFVEVPSTFAQAKQYTAWTTALKDHLYRTRVLTLWQAKALKQTSKPGESEGDFRVRLAQTAREVRDEQVEKLRAKYAPKVAAAQEQLRKAMQRVEKEKSQASQQTFQAAISFGASVLSAFTGRKLASSANIGRVATSARAASRVAREKADIGHAEESVEAIQKKLETLDADFKAESARLEESSRAESIVLEQLEIKPKKSEINVSRVALAWVPYRRGSDGTMTRCT
jgi:hypothetical protein